MTIKKQQISILFRLLAEAKDTRYGKDRDFTSIHNYSEFCEQLPICFYKDISNEIEEIKKGGTDIFRPGQVNNFAVSAGTSGTGKHLPLTKDRLKSDRKFMRKVIWSYLRQQPNIFRLWGNHISLPGTLEQNGRFRIGEISAFTAELRPWWLSPFQLISTDELVRMPFQQKLDRILDKAIKKDIRVISAAPSWLLTIFQHVLDQTGADSIADVWPNLCLLVCGGVKLANYRPHLEKLLSKPDVDFIETYGASEGYFAFTDDLQKDDMKLVTYNDIFYEFIPDPLPDPDSLAIQETVPLWDVKPNTPYAMIVTNNSGLWRYALNDIVTFTQTDPPRIKVMGRVSEMLDDYGEALYAYEAEQALDEAASVINIDIGTFAVASSLEDSHSIPRHNWFVQATNPTHRNTLDRLAKKLDEILCEKNRHYAIRRESQALGLPEVHSIDQQQINLWLEENGKHKAQGKLPAILRNQEDIDFFK